ncbi:P-loop containing nucleoside triphosphate hydrolase protein [Fomitopsis serialis]|uniref:P-loop containing nucleoside triphosphate hydrolase protein n=1 Tax=Fomitopsis serialis TaxID=139415 RepID=UPI002008DC53|nr:P-loop containing nucleoside triphosphate hydrolase protein [Neoantrodia serialis]KAH9928963.1 P-loop containing nucleoside triphosphate hydrolase protein [Neoantrodia serialis]
MSGRDVNLSSESGYARRRKLLLTLTKELRAIGAHAHLDLPRIVVIGNQSAGKSSLIEAISGIKVPRDAGTCTRCPMECRLLSSDKPWSCQISIRWEVHSDGRRRNNVEEVPFGAVLTEKAEVEMMLRRAQAAVLNAEIPPSRFLVMDTAKLNDVQPQGSSNSVPFSQNVVCVDISGPDLTDLSFVDLPGIIQNADQNVVLSVERMVRTYISGTCLIVVALPMSDDIENQRALRLAREADRDGSRTIGVMTKPDTLGAGSIKAKQLWLDILEGRAQSHRLRHGYYCTRQPDDAERSAGITFAEAREAEVQFFADMAPWNTSVEQKRFGTNNLVRYLSGMLTDIINSVIPKLQRDVDDKLAACYTELKSMPQQITGEQTSYVLRLLTLFYRDVHSYVDGGPRTECLVQKNRQEYENLKRAIHSTAPRFIPLLSAEDAPANSSSDPRRLVNVDSEDEEPTKTDTDHGTRTEAMYLSDMRLHIQRSTTRELPFNVPYPAKTALIRSFQATWEQASIDCFERIQRYFRYILSQLIRSRFGRFKKLESTVDAAITDLLGARRTATLEQIVTLLKFESTPFTQNTHYLSDTTAKTLARYKDIREGKIRNDVHRLPGVDLAPLGNPSDAEGNHIPGNPFAQLVPKPTSYLSHPLRPSTPIPARVNFGGDLAAAANRPEAGNSVPSLLSVNRQGHPQGRSVDLEGQSAHGHPTTAANFKSPVQATSAQEFARTAFHFGDGGSGATLFGVTSETSKSKPSVCGPSPGFVGFSPKSSASGTVFGAPGSQRPPISSALFSSDGPERVRLEAEALSALAKLGYTGLTADDLGKLHPPDEYEEELNVMAEVRAYFQVSYKRIIDYIPLAIDHTFLFAFAEALQPHLIEDLALGKPDAAARCATYLVEDLDIVTRRQELIGRKTSLKKARMELMNASLAGVDLSAPS